MAVIVVSAWLMSDQILGYIFQNAAYAVELSVCLLLVVARKVAPPQRPWSLRGGVLLLDGIARPAVLHHFGPSPLHYAYFYWLTDVALALGAFLLIGSFFRRACADEEIRWRFIRLMLVSVFVLVVGRFRPFLHPQLHPSFHELHH